MRILITVLFTITLILLCSACSLIYNSEDSNLNKCETAAEDIYVDTSKSLITDITNNTSTDIDDNSNVSPLDLLKCSINENGYYQADMSNLLLAFLDTQHFVAITEQTLL